MMVILYTYIIVFALPAGVWYCIDWWRYKAPEGFSKNLFRSQKIVISIAMIILTAVAAPFTIYTLIKENNRRIKT